MSSLNPPDAAVQRRMRNQPREGTKPELELRRLLHSKGLRYRIGLPVPGASRRSIDICFSKARVAIFVDGCFWHRCPDHSVPAKNNAPWWDKKLQANVERDRSTDHILASRGWTVVRVWEHEDMRRAAERIQALIRPSAPD